ncbi:3755_t:CDS:1 [Dentiscutata heterogama]|uniref:3755_t:CDS:1 n=1 Tax=Dentiscutata heterogama TaxID=1316150 RepID=A0ACA9L462_9GLOM|nr:3755_t:CDS:1 [Dentiscutata heterogama]
MRNPYVAHFQHRRRSEVRITLVGCHTKPKNAYDEVRALVTDVYPFVKDEVMKLANERTKSKELFSMDDLMYAFDNLNMYDFNFSKFVSERKESRKKVFDEPIIMMGDFNASGTYLREDECIEVDRLLQQNKLVWGINHGENTMVGSKASYDRFIFEAEVANKMIKSVKVWRFNKDWSHNDPSIVEEAIKRN